MPPISGVSYSLLSSSPFPSTLAYHRACACACACVSVCVCVCEMDEAQAGFKIAGRNINNLRYADDTTLMAESEEELKSLWMKVKYDSKKNLA